MANDLADIVLHWRTDEVETANLGEGISRPKSGKDTRMYRVCVRFSNALPMRATLRAETKRHALKYAKNRWPSATCVVEGVVNGSVQ